MIPRRTRLTPAAAMADPRLLGDHFRGPSWDRWRAVLAGAYGEPLDERALALFREVAERDPPKRQVRELWCIVGRRGGKDSVASAIATVTALRDYRRHLRPGERASILCMAVDRMQARIIHRYVSANFTDNPQFAPLVESETDDGLELKNRVEIIIATNSFRAVRGKTIAAVIFDEVAYWRSEESANPDEEVYNAVLPGMVTIPGAILVGISSPYRRRGLQFERWRHAYGKDDPDVLVVRGASRLFNPLLPQEIVDKALERDPEAAAAEWLAEWRSDLSDFLDRELVESAVDAGVAARPPQPAASHLAFVDPSGGRGSAFTAAIAHADGATVIVDAVFERRAPFDPAAVVADLAGLLRQYGVARVVGDRYAGAWVSDAFARHGVTFEPSQNDRSRIYLGALPIFTSARARLPDHERAVHQLCSLERRSGHTGKDTVSAPAGGQDDVANAVCGALVLAATEAAPSLIPAASVRAAAAETDEPLGVVEAVLGVIWLRFDGRCGWAVFAQRVNSESPLLLLDFDEGYWRVELLDMITRCLDEAAEKARENPRARNRGVHVLFYCQSEIIQSAAGALARAFEPRRGRLFIDAAEIEAKLVHDPVRLAFAASTHWQAGEVKLSARAGERSSTVPLAGAVAMRPGERIDDDPLRMAVFIGIVLALHREADFSPPSIQLARVTS